jgi:hypothetical protein
MLHRRWIILFILTGIFVWFEAPSWAATLESLLPTKGLPKGWARVEGPQIFTKKTLFEHIDGEAEVFLKYGFQKSVFAVYQYGEHPENQIEMDIYDLGNVLQAFGVFSRFRNVDRPGGFGLDSFLDEHSAFFYQGRYFVILHVPEPNREILRQFSQLISSKISDPSPPPREISYFPKNSLKPGSIQYFSEGLLGHQFLGRGFQGTYVEEARGQAEDEKKGEVEVKAKVEDEGVTKAEQKEFRLFLAIFQDSQKANNALRDFKDDLSKKGKVSSRSTVESETRELKGEDPYQGKVVVVQKGAYLLGMVGFEKEESGENRLAEFVRKVK